MNTRTLLRFVSLVAFIFALSGCGNNVPAPGAFPFGPPVEIPLLAPFSGDWGFDFDKTLDTLKRAGATDDEISRLRKSYALNPLLGKMHPDMTITGNQAVCPGFLASEYRFFAMHKHDGKVCGKAWHHEDRSDPGDMSKCYVRMEIKDNCLYMDVRMKEGLPELNDPDLKKVPPPELDSAEQCDANNPSGSGWDEWTTYVFVRKQTYDPPR